MKSISTMRGDGGETSLAGGVRVSKGSARVETYGTIDELNSSHRLRPLDLRRRGDGRVHEERAAGPLQDRIVAGDAGREPEAADRHRSGAGRTADRRSPSDRSDRGDAGRLVDSRRASRRGRRSTSRARSAAAPSARWCGCRNRAPRFSPRSSRTSTGCPTCCGCSAASSNTTPASADRCASRPARPAIVSPAPGKNACETERRRPFRAPRPYDWPAPLLNVREWGETDMIRRRAIDRCRSARSAIGCALPAAAAPRASSPRRRASPRRCLRSVSAIGSSASRPTAAFRRRSRRLPKVGTFLKPDAETIAGASPGPGVRARSVQRHRSPARARSGFPFAVVDRGSLPSVFATIRQIARPRTSPSAATASSPTSSGASRAIAAAPRRTAPRGSCSSSAGAPARSPISSRLGPALHQRLIDDRRRNQRARIAGQPDIRASRWKPSCASIPTSSSTPSTWAKPSRSASSARSTNARLWSAYRGSCRGEDRAPARGDH